MIFAFPVSLARNHADRARGVIRDVAVGACGHSEGDVVQVHLGRGGRCRDGERDEGDGDGECADHGDLPALVTCRPRHQRARDIPPLPHRHDPQRPLVETRAGAGRRDHEPRFFLCHMSEKATCRRRACPGARVPRTVGARLASPSHDSGEVARHEGEDVRVVRVLAPADLVTQHALEVGAGLPCSHLTRHVVLRDEDLDPLEP
jgi:hypothetical protein